MVPSVLKQKMSVSSMKKNNNTKSETMKKKISLKLFLIVMWRRACQTFRFLSKLFTYNDKHPFVKFMWHICSICIMLLLVICTGTAIVYLIDEVIYPKWIRPYTSECIANEKHLSNHIVFQEMEYRDKGRVYDKLHEKVVLKGVDWVITSEDKDSLAVFAKNGKRGYLNRFTGKVALPAIYSRAWIFSEGIAAVEKEHKLMFIDHTGKIIIDKHLSVHFNHPQYAFHDGYCIARSTSTGKFGLLDKLGNWALYPEYDDIYHAAKYWRVYKNGLHGLFNDKLKVIFPIEHPSIEVYNDAIEVEYQNHIIKRYDHNGNILVDFTINSVENMHYATTELQNTNNGEECFESSIYDVANCMKYMVRNGYYNEYCGLMDRNGKRITPPEYTSIEAIGKDLYLCYPHKIIINSQGIEIK